LQDRRDGYRQSAVRSFIAVNLVLVAILLFLFLTREKRKYPRKNTKTNKRFKSFAQKWHETFNAISDGVCIIDKSEGKILECNSAMTRFLKRPYDEIVGRSCCELLHNSSEPIKKCPLVRMYESQRSEAGDFEIGDNWFNIKVEPLKNKEGDLIGAVHIMSDITEQRKANRAVRQSENKFRLAFANAQDAIVWIDVESGVITNCEKKDHRAIAYLVLSCKEQ
jgi:PAS domain S-box-containing protein